MNKEELVKRLMNTTNLSCDENRKVLEETNWDILDAILLLEERGQIVKPEVSVFYTNKIYDNDLNNEVVNVKDRKEEKKSFIENICSIIDKSNNIFFKIARNNRVLIKLPLTVIFLLLLFTFWITVPLFVAGFFYDIEYSFIGRGIENTRINEILRKISIKVKDRKNKKGGEKVE